MRIICASPFVLYDIYNIALLAEEGLFQAIGFKISLFGGQYCRLTLKELIQRLEYKRFEGELFWLPPNNHIHNTLENHKQHPLEHFRILTYESPGNHS